MTGEIVYGGRVTDDIDRKTIMMILTTFISEDVLKEGYKYSESGVYTPALAIITRSDEGEIISIDDRELSLTGLL